MELWLAFLPKEYAVNFAGVNAPFAHISFSGAGNSQHDDTQYNDTLHDDTQYNDP
jgi:hypothetical protein